MQFYDFLMLSPPNMGRVGIRPGARDVTKFAPKGVPNFGRGRVGILGPAPRLFLLRISTLV